MRHSPDIYAKQLIKWNKYGVNKGNPVEFLWDWEVELTELNFLWKNNEKKAEVENARGVGKEDQEIVAEFWMDLNYESANP